MSLAADETIPVVGLPDLAFLESADALVRISTEAAGGGRAPVENPVLNHRRCSLHQFHKAAGFQTRAAN